MIEVRGLAQAVVDRIFAASGQKDRVLLHPGTRSRGVLRVAANVAEAETVTIGADVYEVDVINTDTGINTAGGEWNNVLDPILVTMAAHGVVAGDFLGVETELFKVLRVPSVNTLVLARERGGTTNVAHANGLDIFKSNSIVTAGRIPWPTRGTLTPAVMTPSLADEINNWPAPLVNGERATAKASTIYGSVNAYSLQAGAELYVEALAAGPLFTALSETLAGVNNQWSSASLNGGTAHGVKKYGIQGRIPTATEVALGFIRFTFDFTPTKVRKWVVVAAGGADKAHDGAVAVLANRVSVDNAGAADWAATDIVYVEAWE